MAETGITLSGKEVAQHNSRESCWIIVHGMVNPSALVFINAGSNNYPIGKVYDVTEFLDGI